MKIKLQHLMEWKERLYAFDIARLKADAAQRVLALYEQFLAESYGLKGDEHIGPDGTVTRPVASGSETKDDKRPAEEAHV